MLAGITLLLVEDHDDSRDALAMWFDYLGATVVEARDAFEALEVLGAGLPPDVIVCDIHMPGMDGCELLAQLRSQVGLAHIPVIAITGDPRLARVREAGFDAQMLKPFAVRIVGESILGLLGR